MAVNMTSYPCKAPPSLKIFRITFITMRLLRMLPMTCMYH